MSGVVWCGVVWCGPDTDTDRDTYKDTSTHPDSRHRHTLLKSPIMTAISLPVLAARLGTR